MIKNLQENKRIYVDMADYVELAKETGMLVIGCDEVNVNDETITIDRSEMSVEEYLDIVLTKGNGTLYYIIDEVTDEYAGINQEEIFAAGEEYQVYAPEAKESYYEKLGKFIDTYNKQAVIVSKKEHYIGMFMAKIDNIWLVCEVGVEKGGAILDTFEEALDIINEVFFAGLLLAEEDDECDCCCEECECDEEEDSECCCGKHHDHN